MADQFEDLRDYLHRSGIGSAEGTPGGRDSTLTTMSAERALAEILTRRRRSTRRRTVAVGSAAASVILICAVLGLQAPGAPEPRPAEPALAALSVVPDGQAAARILDQAAQAAHLNSLYSASPSSIRGWYTWEQDAAGPPDTIPTLTTIRPGRGGNLLVVEENATPLDPNGRISPSAAGEAPNSRSHTVTEASAAGATAPSLASIIGTPCTYDTIACALEAITDFRTRSAPETVISDSSLWEALATNQGISALGRTTDRLGRQVAVIAADSLDGRTRIALLIDPTTGRHLGTEFMALNGSAAATVRFVTFV